MSLAVLADHMASKGRGPDSMLIHMSPREVQGLQALAMAHGGSLTVNPDTGLPEAGFLDKLLPTIIGAGLSFIPGVGPLMAAGIVGGIQTVRTGDIGKGLAAGLGAYGGAGLAQGLATAGTGALSAEVGGEALKAAGLTGEAALTAEADQIAQRAIEEKLTTASPFERLSAGASQAVSSPQAAGAFLKDNAKNLMYAAGPAILAGANVQSKGPQTITKPGMIRPYSFDPYGGTYTAGTPYEAAPTKAADGGLMGMAAGGMAGYGDGDDVPRRTIDGMAQGGMYDFAQRSEPVVRMADGGILKMATGTPPAMFDDEALFKKTGSWEAAAAARDAQNVALRAYEQQQNSAANIMADANRLRAALGAAPATQASAIPGVVDVTKPGQYVTDPATGNAVALSAYSPGFDPNNKITQTYLGELAAKGGTDTTSQMFNQMGASKAQQDTNASAWAAEKARLDALDAAKVPTGLAGLNQNQNLLTNQNKDAGLAALANIPDSASYTNRWFAERGLGFDPLDKSIDSFLATYKNQLAAMTPKQQEDAMRAALATEKMNEADVIAATGMTIAQLAAAKRADGSLIVAGPIDEVPVGSLPLGVSGAGITTVNPNGTITTRPDLSLQMKDVRDAYEDGGGSLGVNKNLFAPSTTKQIEDRYKLTGGSKAALDYLMGKAPYSPTPYTPTGEIQKPYWESVGRFPENRSTKKYVFVNGKYQLNPDYVKPSYVLAGEKAAADKAAAADKKTTGTTDLTNQDEKPTSDPGSGNEWLWDYASKKWYASPIQVAAAGGLMAMARGGMTQQFNLGDYSDGGRLLRGPGDGVSDSIPATIGGKRPARLADGEFVVPARIVSELGNGSTEAGARKLYAMMDRIQKARRGTVGKGRVAKNSRSDKYLPA